MRFRFIHTADLHLDSPLKNLENYEGAPVEEIRLASRRALKRLVDHAIEEEVRFVLIAGDLYDGDLKDYKTAAFFRDRMAELNQKSIGVFIVKGNHDAQNRISKQLLLPDNCFVFDHKSPQTIRIDDLDCALHGQSFARRNIDENLSANYPPPLKNAFNIGLLHTSAQGYAGHDVYAPCKPSELAAKGYDYWALGHVHSFEILNEAPWIVYPGVLQGRHIRETGAKGYVLVEVEDRKVTQVEQIEADHIRWFHQEIDLTGAKDGYDALDLIEKGTRSVIEANPEQILALRLELKGACGAHSELVENEEMWRHNIEGRLGDQSGGRIWLEKLIFSIRPPVDLDARKQKDDLLGFFLRSMDALSQDKNGLSALSKTFDPLLHKLPSDFRKLDLLPQDDESMRQLIEEVRFFLYEKLVEKG